MSRMPPILPMLPKTPLPQTSGIDWLRHGDTRGGSRFRGRTDDPLTPEGWRQMWTTVAHYHAGARLAHDDESPLHELRPNLHQGFATSLLTNEVAGDFCADSREGPRQVPESEDLRRDWHADQPVVLGRRDAPPRPWDRIIASTLVRCADFGRALSQRLDLPLSLDPRLVELDFGAWEGRSAADLMVSDAEALGRFWADPVTHSPPGPGSGPGRLARPDHTGTDQRGTAAGHQPRWRHSCDPLRGARPPLGAPAGIGGWPCQLDPHPSRPDPHWASRLASGSGLASMSANATLRITQDLARALSALVA